MNHKRKTQMLFMLILLFLLVGIFVFLKIMPEEETESTQETESYQVLNVDTSVVTEIGITTSEGTVDLLKESDGWKCVSDETVVIDDEKVDAFLNNVCAVTSDTKIEGVTDMTEYGLSNPVMQVTLQWEDNLYTIKAGDYNSIVGCYYISLNEEDVVYTADSILYTAMNKTLSDFEKEEEEETETTVAEEDVTTEENEETEEVTAEENEETEDASVEENEDVVTEESVETEE